MHMLMCFSVIPLFFYGTLHDFLKTCYISKQENKKKPLF